MVLHVGGAESVLYVHVNGRPVGMSKDSRLPAEFDVTPFLVEGENLLEAMVDAGWTATAVVSALSLGLVLVMGLGLVAAMVMRPTTRPVRIHGSLGLYLVAALASLTILLLGILPGGILELAIRSAGSVLP